MDTNTVTPIHAMSVEQIKEQVSFLSTTPQSTASAIAFLAQVEAYFIDASTKWEATIPLMAIFASEGFSPKDLVEGFNLTDKTAKRYLAIGNALESVKEEGVEANSTLTDLVRACDDGLATIKYAKVLKAAKVASDHVGRKAKLDVFIDEVYRLIREHNAPARKSIEETEAAKRFFARAFTENAEKHLQFMPDDFKKSYQALKEIFNAK